jgi:acyl-coenzyme A thioesterase PaaI-like protein
VKASVLRRIINLWPPLFFSGITVNHLSEDYTSAKVTLKLRWYNRNYVGVQYGGSLMSMTDPWYMLMLFHVLGNDYFVWDIHAEIDYVSPGKTHVYAEFLLTPELIEEVKEKTKNGEKYLPEFTVEIRDNNQQLVARVKRRVYVKLKPRARSQ